MGRAACTEPKCLYSRAIPLLPLWAIRPVQYSYTSTPPMGRTACTEPQCLYSRAIPLLPLWAVWTVQSLSACTVELYLYYPYGPYGLYRASVPVQGCTFPFFFLMDEWDNTIPLSVGLLHLRGKTMSVVGIATEQLSDSSSSLAFKMLYAKD